MLKYIFKMLIWRLTPESKRGDVPARPVIDSIKVFTKAIIFFAILSAALTYHQNIKIVEGEISLSEFWAYMEAEEVEAVIFGAGDIQLVQVEMHSGKTLSVLNPLYPEFRKDVMDTGVPVRYASGTPLSALVDTLTTVIVLVVLLVVCVVMLRTVAQSNELKAQRGKDSGITFNDVRGMSETKEEVRFAVEQLKNRAILKEMGARPVKGILFEGPPGTGKTLLAKAIAGEAGVPLISASGSDFIEMFVGVGAARIRRLWQQAEDSAPCVLFIDEIDAVGRARGINTHNMENNQTINALLQRMDGLGTRSDVMVIGATNRKEDLDPALMRPGRFDRTVYIGAPRTHEDRVDICDLYLSRLNLMDGVTADNVAKLTAGMTGADIAQCLNDAALIAAREADVISEEKNDSKDGKGGRVVPVTLKHIDSAITRHLLGGVATGHITESDRRLAAVHEAGHAIVRLSSGVEVLKVSVTPYTSGAGGLTQSDIEETMFLSQQELLDRLCFVMGGLASECVVNGSHSTGVADDLKKASELALRYVTCFGAEGLLNEEALKDMVGFRGMSDGKLKKAEEVMQREAQRAKDICTEHRSKLDLLVRRLLEETTVLNLVPGFLGDGERGGSHA